jgi:hypothetical protein
LNENYFFVNPFFLSGVARAVDVGGALDETSYRLSRSGEEADTRAIASDWAAVGSDLRKTFESHEQQEEEASK